MARFRRPLTTALAIATLAVGVTAALPAQGTSGPARIREYRQSFPTYPFSDPNPIPVVGRIYPYFRFDGFAATATPREWKVVELENDYIRVLILPEIGGKIWAAIEKKTGRPFVYFNRAVKFRDIAMRGPWTSGGIEANYGIIGHTPNVSTPVDYVVRTNADGSVSCVTGALDLLTGTTWRVETRLARTEASFTTSSTWHNGSPLEQPYYTWMTAGIPVRGNLQYVFPGTSQIGHEGERGEWPINTTLGRDVSWYERNDFGGYKSYHVFGGAGDFFGAYWHDQDFGMARVAPRDQKPGQKIWIWGLSRQGMIWEDLLTDRDGQYSELQSGRLFNQSAEGSTFTPFKHRGFTPHLTDRWTERWMPVVGTKGFVVAGNAGALNVTQHGDTILVALSPAEPVDDSLIVTAGGRRLRARRITRAPLAVYADTISAPGVSLASVTAVLGDHKLEWTGDATATALDRPLDTPKAFDWRSAYGTWLRGKELLRQREFGRATVLIDSALARDATFVPALVDRAALALRAMQYEAARTWARAALAVDTYDGAANYLYGLASRHLGRAADARDGFEIATQSVEYRAAAWTELAKLWLAQGDPRRAQSYAAQAVTADPANLDALGVQVVAARRRSLTTGRSGGIGGNADWARAVSALERADPLSQLVRFERDVAARGMAGAGARLFAQVRSELPAQALFELASWYQGVGEGAHALALLEGVGEQPEALYWRAALGDSLASRLVARANQLSPTLVFPFRPEVTVALERAVAATDHWKPRYYLALAYWGSGRAAQAASLLAGLGNAPDHAPVYAARAALPSRSAADQLADLRRAAALDSSEWRYGKLLAERMLSSGDAAGAAAVTSAYHARMPANYILGLTKVRALLAAGRHADAEVVLRTLAILPYEGAAEGHALWREAQLLCAVDAMRDKQWAAAEAFIAAARTWPERLGAGRPYDADVDERLEEWLQADVQARRGNAEAARSAWERLAARRAYTGALGDLFTWWSLERLGRGEEAQAALASRRREAPGDAVASWAADRAKPLQGRFGVEGRVLARWARLSP